MENVITQDYLNDIIFYSYSTVLLNRAVTLCLFPGYTEDFYKKLNLLIHLQ